MMCQQTAKNNCKGKDNVLIEFLLNLLVCLPWCKSRALQALTSIHRRTHRPGPLLPSIRTVIGSGGVQVTRLYCMRMRPLTNGANCAKHLCVSSSDGELRAAIDSQSGRCGWCHIDESTSFQGHALDSNGKPGIPRHNKQDSVDK